MKKFKKMMALVLSMVMVLAMGVTAFAANEDGSITIKNSEQGTTYNFYKILDLTGKATSNSAEGKYDAISYTIASAWEEFFKGDADGVSYLISAANVTEQELNQINFDGTLYYLNLTDNNVVEFTNSAMKYAIEKDMRVDASAIGDGGEVVKRGLDLGYYLIVPVDASEETQDSSGSIASLTSTIPDAEIFVKATKPTIEKMDDTISADIGQTVTYTLTGVVPNTSGYETYKYIISDKMSTGLTFQKNVKIKINDKEITSDATIDYETTKNGFSANIPVKELQEYVGQEITLTYTAIVNEDAVTVPQAENTATLQYGHDPEHLEESTPVSEEVYSAKVIINKYTGNDAAGDISTKLAGAKFALMNDEGQYYKYTEATNEGTAKVEWVTIDKAPTEGEESVSDAQAKALVEAEDAGKFTSKTTNENGAAEFPGIADGTYYLVEFVAPDGYNRLDKPQVVKVEGTDVDTDDTSTENIANATGKFDSANDATADVQNNSGSLLPSTGGIGTTIFYVIGAILVIGAGVVLVTKKRMANK